MIIVGCYQAKRGAPFDCVMAHPFCRITGAPIFDFIWINGLMVMLMVNGDGNG